MTKDDDDKDDKDKDLKFDGSDPSKYKSWKRKSQVHLLGLPDSVPDTKHGPRLMGLLRGKAEEDIVENIMNDPEKKKLLKVCTDL